MTLSDSSSVCPCDSGLEYAACCRPFHEGALAPTPETLMRSRYSAFVKVLPTYLLDTWHPSTRPSSLNLEGSPAWCRLTILAAKAATAEGTVHFRACYRAGNGWGYLEERSRFLREGGQWFYLDGETKEGVLKPGRNEPCPCGSGRKFKACCS